MRVPGKPGKKKPTTPGGRAKPIQKQPVEPGRKAKPEASARPKKKSGKMPPELLERFKGKSAAKKKPPEKAKGKGVSAGGMKKRMSSKMKKK